MCATNIIKTYLRMHLKYVLFLICKESFIEFDGALGFCFDPSSTQDFLCGIDAVTSVCQVFCASHYVSVKLK